MVTNHNPVQTNLNSNQLGHISQDQKCIHIYYSDILVVLKIIWLTAVAFLLADIKLILAPLPTNPLNI